MPTRATLDRLLADARPDHEEGFRRLVDLFIESGPTIEERRPVALALMGQMAGVWRQVAGDDRLGSAVHDVGDAAAVERAAAECDALVRWGLSASSLPVPRRRGCQLAAVTTGHLLRSLHAPDVTADLLARIAAAQERLARASWGHIANRTDEAYAERCAASDAAKVLDEALEATWPALVRRAALDAEAAYAPNATSSDDPGLIAGRATLFESVAAALARLAR